MAMRYRIRRPAGNAVDEQSPLGELSEDLMAERALYTPIFAPGSGPGAPLPAREFDGTLVTPRNPTPTDAPLAPKMWRNPYKFVAFPVVTGNASGKVLTANNKRCYLLIQNKDAQSVWVNFGTNATIAAGYEITGGGALEFIGGEKGGGFCPQEDVYLQGFVGGQNVMIGEGTFNPNA